ncbi:MAG TPA: hypothetical protein VHK06_03145, partial [Candidatus Limnocylindria bacterium]|nr:hypothetical protein [Candidatus Limnocylindria bacterium]
MSIRPWSLALLCAIAAVQLSAVPVAAHEVRQVSGYEFVVGFMDEPVFTNQKSGLEFQVTANGEPVEGLEETLEAEVSFAEQTRGLPLSPRFGQQGWYESVFFPTAAGPYTFRIHGEIAGEAVDESFTSGPETFSEVQDAASGQFPVAFPPTADVVRDAQVGAQAATTATIALAVGGVGLIAALVALGLAADREGDRRGGRRLRAGLRVAHDVGGRRERDGELARGRVLHLAERLGTRGERLVD